MKKLVLFLVVISLVVSACKSRETKQQATSSQNTKPNVLFISVDDLNTWISPIDNFSNVKTPNFDRLAKMGVTFTNAHVQ
ncbi:MAG: sulfatase, partial [Flavobacteriaceae bacterium]